MTKYRLKQKVGDSILPPVEFTIPDKRGKYKIIFTTSDGKTYDSEIYSDGSGEPCEIAINGTVTAYFSLPRFDIDDIGPVLRGVQAIHGTSWGEYDISSFDATIWNYNDVPMTANISIYANTNYTNVYRNTFTETIKPRSSYVYSMDWVGRDSRGTYTNYIYIEVTFVENGKHTSLAVPTPVDSWSGPLEASATEESTT